jgi:hypothetical protein
MAWQREIDLLLKTFERLDFSAGERGLRIKIGNAIWETEQMVRRGEPSQLHEKPEDRLREFHTEFGAAIVERSNNDPSNKTWQEALKLLGIPQQPEVGWAGQNPTWL